MADRIEIGWLFDFYGPLLTERQQKAACLILQRGFFPVGNRRARRAFPDKGFTTRFTARRASWRIMKRSLGCSSDIKAWRRALKRGLSALESGQTQRAKEILMRLLSQEEE